MKTVTEDKKVIIFNAPPNSGKDLGAKHIKEVLEGEGLKAYHKEFKTPIFFAVKQAFGISNEAWDELYVREHKELPSYFITINGKSASPRQALINMSEKVIKPLFGEDAFGIAAAKSLEDGVNIFSDGGFEEEIVPIIEKVGRQNVLIIQLTRDGCSFDGDSRNYIYPEGVSRVLLHNKGDDSFFEDIEGVVLDWLGYE